MFLGFNFGFWAPGVLLMVGLDIGGHMPDLTAVFLVAAFVQVVVDRIFGVIGGRS
jgi:hypothetical protein